MDSCTTPASKIGQKNTATVREKHQSSATESDRETKDGVYSLREGLLALRFLDSHR